MMVLVKKSCIDGAVRAPPSKSLTHRALVCSSLADGKSELVTPLLCDDTKATLEALETLGTKFSFKRDKVIVEGGQLKAPEREIFCRNSGTTLRFMTAVCSLVGSECKLTGSSSLMRRPIEPLLAALRQLGVDCRLDDMIVSVKGKPKGGEVKVYGEISSQFISAILLIAPLCEKKTLILCEKPSSKPYIRLTLEVQRKFGVKISGENMFEVQQQKYKPTMFKVEGDWSSAANILAAAALCGKAAVEELNLESVQADKRIIDMLKMMNVKVNVGGEKVVVEKSDLEAIEFDVTDCPDLFPIACILAAQAKGASIVHGIGRLRFKESNRVDVMIENLKKMGVRTELGEDSLKVYGSKPLGATINPYNDHRIAMAFTVLALVAEGETRILDGECVNKSFPEFWDAMKGLGANIKVIE
ncbi:MAG: 3-phosphoshikimate 1-carboxyvinyltransferase [Nitrososphaeria archaeon]